jgi:arylsulfatase A-like enzyme
MRIFLLISLVLLAIVAAFFSFSRQKHPNVVLIMIDTLRADHLGAYGYKRNTSPFIDDFASNNTVAKRAIAVAPWTPPSVASILTGLSVLRHGLSPDLMETHAKKRGQQLSDEIDTLAEILKSKGYKTAAVSPNPWITDTFNFDQGFDHFFYKKRTTTDVILSAARELLAKISESESNPFFLYVHILDPHGPRTPSPEYASMFSGSVEGRWPYSPEMQEDVNLYDAEIRSVDDQLKVFFEELKAQGKYEDSIVVIVSDHGEQFDEHGQKGHGKNLHIEEVHVPFLVKCPKNQIKNIEATVSNLDVTPTILDCAGIKGSWDFDGISIFDQDKLSTRSGVFSSVNRAFVEEAFSSKDGLRLINSKGRAKNPNPDWELKGLYDINQDPLEAKSISDEGLKSELNSYLDTAKSSYASKGKAKPSSANIASDAIEQLESLGYIND